MDPNTAIIIAIVAVGISITGVLLSDWRTRQAISLTKQDLNSKLRPWLKIDIVTPTYVTLKNNSILEYDEFVESEIKSIATFRPFALLLWSTPS